MSASGAPRATMMAVIPARAGQGRSPQNARRAAPLGRAQRVIQLFNTNDRNWIPAFAGMTKQKGR
jgi:hypothetical protein